MERCLKVWTTLNRFQLLIHKVLICFVFVCFFHSIFLGDAFFKAAISALKDVPQYVGKFDRERRKRERERGGRKREERGDGERERREGGKESKRERERSGGVVGECEAKE